MKTIPIHSPRQIHTRPIWLLAISYCLLASSAHAQNNHHIGSYSGFPSAAPSGARAESGAVERYGMGKGATGKINPIIPDSMTVWVDQVHTNGLIIGRRASHWINGVSFDKAIALTNVANFDTIAIDQRLSINAKPIGHIDAANGQRIELWDCGHPKPKPVILPTLEEIAARQASAKAAAEAKQQAGRAKALQWHQQLADKGDAFGQYEMGRRYLTGDGVEKDESKAKEYFVKSAAQGNKAATEALQKLEAK